MSLKAPDELDFKSYCDQTFSSKMQSQITVSAKTLNTHLSLVRRNGKTGAVGRYTALPYRVTIIFAHLKFSFKECF